MNSELALILSEIKAVHDAFEKRIAALEARIGAAAPGIKADVEKLAADVSTAAGWTPAK